VSASQLSWRLGICNGKDRSLRLLSALLVLSCLLEFALLQSGEAFQSLVPVKAGPTASLCREGQACSITRYDKVVAVHSLGSDTFLLAALGKRAKGKRIWQEAGSDVFKGED